MVREGKRAPLWLIYHCKDCDCRRFTVFVPVWKESRVAVRARAEVAALADRGGKVLMLQSE